MASSVSTGTRRARRTRAARQRWQGRHGQPTRQSSAAPAHRDRSAASAGPAAPARSGPRAARAARDFEHAAARRQHAAQDVEDRPAIAFGRRRRRADGSGEEVGSVTMPAPVRGSRGPAARSARRARCAARLDLQRQHRIGARMAEIERGDHPARRADDQQRIGRLERLRRAPRARAARFRRRTRPPASAARRTRARRNAERVERGPFEVRIAIRGRLGLRAQQFGIVGLEHDGSSRAHDARRSRGT